jgi:cephalosporin hydroxylase
MSQATKRVARVAHALIESGPRSVLLTRGAKRRGAVQKTLEFSALVALLRARKLSTIVEIGTLHGGTLWTWCQLAAPNALIVSIDLPGGDFGGGYGVEAASRLQRYARARQQLHLIQGDSHAPATLEQLEKLLDGREVDFLFIDGDHTYDGVCADFDMYAGLVGRGGIVALHDILLHPTDPDCQVDRLWRDLRAVHSHRELIDPDDTRARGQWGGIGVIFN